jgi:tetratricopeptide (TPR) repeat protein
MFDDAIALLRQLEATHEPGIHLYRGQTRRFTHDWIDDAGPVRLESLYPSDYRFITRYDGRERIPPHDITAARSHGRTIRDQFAAAVTMRALSGDPAFAWLQGHVTGYAEHAARVFDASDRGRRVLELARETDQDLSAVSTPLARILWSLAQHYLIATALTDVTFAPRVAAWFATHPWDASHPVPSEGAGVIYRFRRPELEAVLERRTRAMRDWARGQGLLPAPALFCVDIREIPVSFASRPGGQEGGSIYGFDQPKVLRDVFESGCAEIFEFRHGPAAASLGSLRERIMPADDPFLPRGDAIRAALAVLKPRLASREPANAPGGAETGAADYLQHVVTTARLAILGARFTGRVPLEDGHAGYHFVDIETLPGASHGYAHLLVIVNDKTRGVSGYVSAEPMGPAGTARPLQPYVMAQWIGGRRAVVDLTADVGTAEGFLDRAIPVANRALAATRSPADAVRHASIADAVDAGARLLAESRFEEAESILTEAVARGSAEAANNLGAMHVVRHQYDRAESAYRKALELGDREAAYNLGSVFEAKGDAVQAEHYFRRALEEHHDPRAANNLAIALLHQGRRDEAERYLRLGRAMGDELAARNLEQLLQGGDGATV